MIPESETEIKMRSLIKQIAFASKEYEDLRNTLPVESRLNVTCGMIVACWDLDNAIETSYFAGGRHLVAGVLNEVKILHDETVSKNRYEEKAKRLRGNLQ